MKKPLMLLALLSLLVLPFALAGCGGDGETADDTEETASDTAEAEDTEEEIEASLEPVMSLTAFYDVELDDYFIYALDDAGQLWAAWDESWEKEGTPCPGEAPYDLAAFSTPDDWYIMALDANGDLYIAYLEWGDNDARVIEWDDQGIQLKGEAPYSLASFYAPDTNEVFIEVIDNSGQLWFLDGTTWKEDGTSCPGEAPYDFVTFNDDNREDAWYTFVIDNSGIVYFFNGEEWVESDMSAASDAPFTLAGSFDPIANGFMIVVLDSSGEISSLSNSTDMGFPNPELGGTAPYDSSLFYDSEADTFVFYAVDARGELFGLIGEKWVSLIDSM